MQAKRNFQRELDEIIKHISAESVKPKLLLHACCAPCSSYCLEYLNRFFDITLYFYNPNIFPEKEYIYRAEELEGLLKKMGFDNINLVKAEYDNREFFDKVKGLENEPERGERCTICYHLRLESAVEYAEKNGFDYVTTTLSISPYKDAYRLVSIGEKLTEGKNVKYLTSDFKKKNGYKRSIELSSEYGLYRQDYCGCIYSKNEKLKLNENKKDSVSD